MHRLIFHHCNWKRSDYSFLQQQQWRNRFDQLIRWTYDEDDREKALLNELRSHDFFFSDGDGDGDDGDDAGSVACCGGEQDDAELMLVSCEARLDTESLDSCRLPSCNSPLQYIFFCYIGCHIRLYWAFSFFLGLIKCSVEDFMGLGCS